MTLRGITDISAVIRIGQKAVEVSKNYDTATHSLTLELPAVNVGEPIAIDFPQGLPIASNALSEQIYTLLDRAQITYDLKDQLLHIVQEQGTSAVATLASFHLHTPLFGALCEILSAELQ